MCYDMLFVKAAKILSLGFVFTPFAGCAVATGLIFGALLRSISYSPDQEEILFAYGALGFAFVETFALILFAIAGLIIFL